MSHEAPENSPASETVVPPTAQANATATQAVAPELPVIPLARPGKHPYQVSPVPEYQTDRYRLVSPYTRF